MNSLQANIKVSSNKNKVTRKVKLSRSKVKNKLVTNHLKSKAIKKQNQSIKMRVEAAKVKTKA